MPKWNCHAVIVKTGDDCRQEDLAMQLIRMFISIWNNEGLSLWLKPYEVLPLSNSTALIELIPDSVSVHSVKHCLGSGSTLADHFFRMFPQGSEICEVAQRAFAESLAGYSLVCYFLQVKDRHNANILMDTSVRFAL
jgi:phosphatidylinositol 4-kinase B